MRKSRLYLVWVAACVLERMVFFYRSAIASATARITYALARTSHHTTLSHFTPRLNIHRTPRTSAPEPDLRTQPSLKS